MNAYESMSRDELAAVIGNMGEKETTKLLKTASAALKAKHPDLPWT
jgi:hypothetical protein